MIRRPLKSFCPSWLWRETPPPMNRKFLVSLLFAGLLAAVDLAPVFAKPGGGGNHGSAGNSGDAPGHDPGGPGNSENAPGHMENRGKARGHQTEPARSEAQRSLTLPVTLVPVCHAADDGCSTALSADGPSSEHGHAAASLAYVPPAALASIAACREGIVRSALPYDPVRIDALGVGELQPFGAGRVLPLFVRIVYRHQNGFEVRQARINCRLDQAGKPIALSSV